ncbi:hypothetical protein L1049_018273 [Liquidambar formosana]|uniref:Uncharacterized protein n=1 Tax=Liquidambar formosana TaxID=63359 RepID=A0AAP0RA04_LIQFO
MTFEFPLSEWENLTHLKFKIMDEELFRDSGFVGETIVHLGGIITEGTDRGLLEIIPAPYNVVLEDDTYKGEIKIGFKFMASKKVHGQTREYVAEEKERRQSICGGIINLWKISWWRFLFFYNQKDSKNKAKQI